MKRKKYKQRGKVRKRDRGEWERESERERLDITADANKKGGKFPRCHPQSEYRAISTI